MSLVGSAILSAYAVTPVFNRVFEDQERVALQYTGKALYRELNLDDYVKKIERKYGGKILTYIHPNVIIISRIAIERRVSFQWRF